ncbi:MAG: LamG-like jellyroll fold domain-containing protein [Candidatus Puniceispirillaceae bacterium]
MRDMMKRFISQSKSSGFSLVELMVTVTLMAVVGIGVVSLMDYVQSTRVRVETSVKLIDDVDKAELFIRTKLKTADRLEFDNKTVHFSDNLFSAECLLLLTRDPRDRTGVNFVQNAGAVRSHKFDALDGTNAFTLGLWFKRDNVSHNNLETLAAWGAYDPVLPSSMAMVMTPFGEMALRFGTKTIFVPSPRELNDKKWHHIVASYDNITSMGVLDSNSVKIYVDGYPRTVSVIDAGVVPNFNMGAGSDNFTIGLPLTSDNSSAFNGVISDVELYSDPVTPSQAAAIYNVNSNPLSMSKELHWPLAIYYADNRTFTDVSGKGRIGYATGLSAQTATVTTTDERYFGDVFALIDMPNDGNDNYALMHRQSHNDCPDNVNEASGFTTISEDIFVRPEDRNFFTRSTDDANDVLFSYGYRSGNGQASFAFEAAPKKLALNKKFFDEDFCRADPSLVLNRPPGVTNCPITRGFAYIATDFDNQTDELFIPNAMYWEDNTTYYNIPGAPSTIMGRWSSETGVMTFTVSDGLPVDIDDWQKALRSLAYRPMQEDYAPTKDLVISLGYLPMKINNQFHFYDFIEFPIGSTVNWVQSQTDAYNSRFCGSRGYLATVTSEEENAFLVERFRKSSGAVPAGWLGGHDSIIHGTWIWEKNSPESGMRFWDQTDLDGSDGRPVKIDNSSTDLTDFLKEEGVVLPGSQSPFTRRVTTSLKDDVVLAYHNLASNEPNNAGGSETINHEPYMQIVGSDGGNGYWNDLPDNRTCKDNEFYHPCGYYVEYGGRPGESLNSLVYERTVDLSAQREFCKQPD